MSGDPQETAVIISASAVKRVLDELPPGASETEILTAAFRACRTDDCAWMLYTDDQRFRAGAGGLLLFYQDDSAMRERIEHELLMLRTLSAAMGGVHVSLPDLDECPEPLGMMKVYRDTA